VPLIKCCGRGRWATTPPRRDLFLSPDHAVYVNEVLVPVRSIAQVATDSVTYYHVELPTHDVVLAEGLAAESYLETGERANFSNGGGVVRQFPDFAARAWEALGCAKLIVTGPELEASRGRVIVSMPASHPGPAAERRAS
jgi:Hint domain